MVHAETYSLKKSQWNLKIKNFGKDLIDLEKCKK